MTEKMMGTEDAHPFGNMSLDQKIDLWLDVLSTYTIKYEYRKEAILEVLEYHKMLLAREALIKRQKA